MHLLPACLSALLLTAALSAAEDATAVAYATWTADPCTTLTVRVLGREPLTAITLRGEGGERTLPTVERPVGGTGWRVAETTATGLAPGSSWTASAGGRDLGRFRTVRRDPPLRFAAGGDLMHQVEWLAATTRAVAAEEPAFALVGGDWAYDNAVEADFGRWVVLLRTWAAATTPSGHGIPVIAGIGNHELGKGIPLERTPFHALFPEPVTRAVDIAGWLSLVLLDSGHSRPVAGQDAWLDEALAARRDRTWRFAAYHVPAYPSVRNPDDGVSPTIREHWVPRFERGGVAACFENHDHARKRTHPLLGGQPAAGGVLYLGDGCWGVSPRPPATPAQRPFLATSGPEHHAWIVDLDRDRGTARAVAAGGAEVDRVVLVPRAAER